MKNNKIEYLENRIQGLENCIESLLEYLDMSGNIRGTDYSNIIYKKCIVCKCFIAHNIVFTISQLKPGAKDGLCENCSKKDTVKILYKK